MEHEEVHRNSRPIKWGLRLERHEYSHSLLLNYTTFGQCIGSPT